MPTKRSILRWIHIIFSIPILGYIYGPVSEVQPYAAAVRFVFLPGIGKRFLRVKKLKKRLLNKLHFC
jgi:hypothetical protein